MYKFFRWGFFLFMFLFGITSSSQTTIVNQVNFDPSSSGWTRNANAVLSSITGYKSSTSVLLAGATTRGTLTSPTLDLSGFDKVEIEFFFNPTAVNTGNEFTLQYSSNNGASWTNLKSYIRGASDDYNEVGVYHHRAEVLFPSDFLFTSTARFRFRATSLAIFVHIDQITILGVNYSTPIEGLGGIANGLSAWYKADMIHGTNFTMDQTIVGTWDDLAQGHHARAVDSTAGGTSSNPRLRNHPDLNINFNPVVVFENDRTYNLNKVEATYLGNGNTDFLFATSGFYSNDIFAVIQPLENVNSSLNPPMALITSQLNNSDRTSLDQTGVWLGSFSPRLDNEIVSYAVGINPAPNPADPFNRSYGLSDSDMLKNLNGPILLNFSNNPASNGMEYYQNGIRQDNTEVGSPQFVNINNGRIWIGRSLGRGAGLSSKVAEIAIFSNRKNDLTERLKIESYLAIKYGITLGNNGVSKNYVDSDGSILFPSSSGFNYNIAGIGRDDISTLNQKQSKSVNALQTVEDITIGLENIFLTNSENTAQFNQDKSFLIWGHDNGSLNPSPAVAYDLSNGIPGLSTIVDYTSINRKWKIVETGSIQQVKVSVPKTLLQNINNSVAGSYFMLVSDTQIFDNQVEIVPLNNFTNHVEGIYDFLGTKFVTFAFIPEKVFKRSFLFSGVSDFLDAGNNHNLDPNHFTIGAWVKISGSGSVFSKINESLTDGYNLEITPARFVRFYYSNMGMQTISSSVPLSQDKWHHIAVTYDGSLLSIYLDGELDQSLSIARGPLSNSYNFLIGASGHKIPNQFLDGNIDELRIWNKALSVEQIRLLMNQELTNMSNILKGTYLNDNGINELDFILSGLFWSDLEAYYPMSKFLFKSTKDESSNNSIAVFKNAKVDFQSAPLPYISSQDGNWNDHNVWEFGNQQLIPGQTGVLGLTIKGNIVELNNNIELNSNVEVFALNSVNNTLTVNGSGLSISKYLKLDGKIDLQSEAQLVQFDNSILDPESKGQLEKDQQGSADNFTYNYFSSPVGIINDFSNNNDYNVSTILRDGTNPLTPLNISFVNTFNGADGSPASPIRISDYWIFKFNGPIGDINSWQQVRRSGMVKVGEGYTMKGPNTGEVDQVQNYTFIGKPNNGDITLNLTEGYNYLIGNPYPSAIDADRFILDNPDITGTLFFWQHEGGGSHFLREYVGGYHMYNLSGSVGYITAPPVIPGLGTKTPARYIPVGQGFFVAANSNGTINFKNSQRAFVTEDNVSNSVFFKANKPKDIEVGKLLKPKRNKTETQTETDTRMKIYFGFTSPRGYYRQLLLTVDERATVGYDRGFDGENADLVNDDMFWLINQKEYIIQGINEISASTVLPLGFKSKEDGKAYLKIEKVLNNKGIESVYVKDNMNNTLHDLLNSTFEFETISEIKNTERFSIVFSPNSEVLSDITKEKTEAVNNKFTYQVKEDLLKFSVDSENPIKSIVLYDIFGRELFRDIEATKIDFIQFPFKKKIIIAKILFKNGDLKTLKFIN
ncbi:MAG: hypothetical protein KKC03_02170 [Bacteroidetes bacterium]|nr:hypothetical protein [Bacteroidota bacterium]